MILRTRAGGWPRWWLRRGITSCLLRPLAWLFAALAAARRATFAHGWRRAGWQAPVPVIVVGNVTAGGAGKTPVVLALARALRAQGWTPGIVSRGHGRDRAAPDPLGVEPEDDPARTGDEPLMLRRMAACPVWVGRHRAVAARALLAAAPDVDVLLSDDGLQHLALARNIELVVVDARGPGNGCLLPAGPLRERWDRRRDATLGPPAALALAVSEAPRFEVRRMLGALRPLRGGPALAAQAFARTMAGRRVAAAAGIGDPSQFFAMLRSGGITLAQTLGLPDHATFDRDPLAGLDADAVIVTEKDALKCSPGHLSHDRIWVAGLQVELDPHFLPWLSARLRAMNGRRDGLSPA